MSITDIFLKGGIFMWPLLACSVLVVAVILEKLIFYFKNRINEAEILRTAKEAILKRKFEKISDLIPEKKIGLSVIIRSFGQNYSKDDLEKRVTLAASRSMQLEERYLMILSVIGKIAPLIGLLGTVAGLVVAFKGIEQKGAQVQPSDMAGGIWIALTSTVFGLLIAIPSLISFAYFRSLTDKNAQKQEALFEELRILAKDENS